MNLAAIHGADTGKVVLDHLVKELDTKGMLKVLRPGLQVLRQELRVAVFALNNQIANPRHAVAVRQKCAVGDAGFTTARSIQIARSGAVPQWPAHCHSGAEKPLSGQTVEDAKRQYKKIATTASCC